MKTSNIFLPSDTSEIDRLVAEHPFALLISAEGSALQATPLPLVLRRSGDEAWLLGHFARGNPHVELARRQPRALAAFLGPHGYVSPSWFRDRSQAPTWNYETVHFELELTLEEGALPTRAALEALVSQVEAGHPQPWTIEDLGPRYEHLARAVVPFRARILDVHAKFKLGQNERADVFEDAVTALDRLDRRPLAEAMRRARAARVDTRRA